MEELLKKKKILKKDIKDYKNNKEAAKLIIKKQPSLYLEFSKTIQQDKEIIQIALEGLDPSFIDFSLFLNDETFIGNVLHQRKYLIPSPYIQNNKSIINMAIINKASINVEIDDKLKNDKEIIDILVKTGNISNYKKFNQDLVSEAIIQYNKKEEFYLLKTNYLTIDLLKNNQVVFNSYVYDRLDPILLKVKKFNLDLIKEGIIDFIPESFAEDEDFFNQIHSTKKLRLWNYSFLFKSKENFIQHIGKLNYDPQRLLSVLPDSFKEDSDVILSICQTSNIKDLFKGIWHSQFHFSDSLMSNSDFLRDTKLDLKTLKSLSRTGNLPTDFILERAIKEPRAASEEFTKNAEVFSKLIRNNLFTSTYQFGLPQKLITDKEMFKETFKDYKGAPLNLSNVKNFFPDDIECSGLLLKILKIQYNVPIFKEIIKNNQLYQNKELMHSLIQSKGINFFMVYYDFVKDDRQAFEIMLNNNLEINSESDLTAILDSKFLQEKELFLKLIDCNKINSKHLILNSYKKHFNQDIDITLQLIKKKIITNIGEIGYSLINSDEAIKQFYITNNLLDIPKKYRDDDQVLTALLKQDKESLKVEEFIHKKDFIINNSHDLHHYYHEIIEHYMDDKEVVQSIIRSNMDYNSYNDEFFIQVSNKEALTELSEEKLSILKFVDDNLFDGEEFVRSIYDNQPNVLSKLDLTKKWCKELVIEKIKEDRFNLLYLSFKNVKPDFIFHYIKDNENDFIQGELFTYIIKNIGVCFNNEILNQCITFLENDCVETIIKSPDYCPTIENLNYFNTVKIRQHSSTVDIIKERTEEWLSQIENQKLSLLLSGTKNTNKNKYVD